MPWISNVKALMQTWYLGSVAGDAIADIISGDINPSGKLPFLKLSDNAAHSFGEGYLVMVLINTIKRIF
jgi:beta-glucosidase